MKKIIFIILIAVILVNSCKKEKENNDNNNTSDPIWKTYNIQNSGLAGNSITAIAEDLQGNIWLATSNGTSFTGVSMYDGNNWITYDSSNSELSGFVNSIIIDTNNIWFGSYWGLVKYDGLSWSIYNSTNSGLIGEHIWSIAIDDNNIIWLSSSDNFNNGYINKFDGTNWTMYEHEINYTTRAVAVDTNNNIWFGTVGGGVFQFDGNDWINYNSNNSGLVYNWVNSIVIDSKNNKWFGTNGLSKFNDTNWTTYYGYVSTNYVHSIALDMQGNKWIGTDWGVSKFDGVNWVNYTDFKNGTIHNSVRALAIDVSGNIWAGTVSGGVSMLKL